MHCIVLCSPQLCNIVFFLAKSCGIWTTCSGAQVVRCRRWKLNVGHLAGYCFFFTSYFLPLFPGDQHLVMKRTCSSNGAPRNLFQKHNIWISETIDGYLQRHAKLLKIIIPQLRFLPLQMPYGTLGSPHSPHLTWHPTIRKPPGNLWKSTRHLQVGRYPPLKLKWLGSPIQFAGYLSGCFSSLGQKQVFWYCSGSK